MAWTSLLLSSRAAEAVEVPKDAAPLWRPRIMRPSFLYCSMGNQNKSRTPWTEESQRWINKEIKINKDPAHVNMRVFFKGKKKTSSINSHSCTTECIGPTPPRMPGSWFFLMSVSHSVTAYWITLSTPRRLAKVSEEKVRVPQQKTLLLINFFKHNDQDSLRSQ